MLQICYVPQIHPRISPSPRCEEGGLLVRRGDAPFSGYQGQFTLVGDAESPQNQTASRERISHDVSSPLTAVIFLLSYQLLT